MAERLRVGVVGCGIGRSHMQGYLNLPEMFEIAAVCDVDETKARQAAEEFAIPEIYHDFDELCRAQNLDIIDICTPPHLHFCQSLAALAAGKHVICEKPLVGSLREVDALKAAEARSGRRLMPIFQYRFGRGVQRLKHLVEQGAAGRAYLTTVETSWLRGAAYYAVEWRGQWQTAMGGVLLIHAIHAHDVLTYILGPVKSVFARIETLVNQVEVEDCASVSLKMADGSLATLSCTQGSAVEITRHRFCFKGLTAESNLRPYDNSGDPWTYKATSPANEEPIRQALAEWPERPEGYAGQFYRYYQALQSGGQLPVTVDEARISLELITAMYYSARTGQPVELPLDPDHPAYGGWLPA